MAYSNRTVVHVFEAGRTEIRASVNEFLGRVYLDLRHYFEPEPGADMAPTKKGISIPSDYLDDLEAAVAAMRKALPPNRRREAA